MSEGLSIKEVHLINIIDHESHNQRKLAEKTGFSLGMTNILLKKLANKGYVKVVQLNGRTLRYILTPQGFKEKLRRTHNYLQDSIRRIKSFQEKLLELLEKELHLVSEVWVAGTGEVFGMTCEVLDGAGIAYQVFTTISEADMLENTLVLSCLAEEPEAGTGLSTAGLRVVNVASLLI